MVKGRIKIGTGCSGVGSPEMALKNLNIPHSVEFAVEIDKFSEKTYKANHNAKEFHSDITKIDYKNLPDIDLFIAGFPCQAFSLAGNRKGFEDTRGTLFFNILELLREKKPASFILENVKGLLSHNEGKTFDVIINSLAKEINGQLLLFPNLDSLGYNVYYQVLNAKDYGIPQNRERVFIIGFKDNISFNFPAKEELKIKLKDILENNVDEKYYLSEKALQGLLNHKENNLKKGNGFGFTIADKEKYSNTLKARYFKDGSEILISEPSTIPLYDKGSQGQRVYSTNGIAVCQSSLGGGGGAKTGLYAIPVLTPDRPEKRQNGRRFKNDGDPMFTITSQDRHGIFNGYRIRRLTPLECFRLMGFPDSFVKLVSDSQLYKQAGNSIVVSVIQKIIKNVLQSLSIKLGELA